MSSYGDIIKQGRREEAHSSSEAKAVNTESGKVVNNNVGKKVNTEKGKTRDNEPVNITIKVPRKHRQFWSSRAKLEGLTMTEVLVEALEQRFGVPE